MKPEVPELFDVILPTRKDYGNIAWEKK